MEIQKSSAILSHAEINQINQIDISDIETATIGKSSDSIDDKKASDLDFPGGYFEDVPESNLRLWFSYQERFGQKRRGTTHEFGTFPLEKERMYDSIHYKVPMKYFQHLVPRQFYVNGVYYFPRKSRLPSWDELFLDLVYVAVIFQVGDILRHREISLQTINEFCLVMIPIWYTWFTIDRLNNIFGSSNITYKIFAWIYHLFVIILGTNAAGVFVPHDNHGTHQESTSVIFISTYVISQSLALIFGFSIFKTMPKVAASYSKVMGIALLSSLPAILSIIYPKHLEYLWWASWIFHLISLKAIVLYNNSASKEPRGIITDTEHQIERLCLFTIVVLGEMFTAIVYESKDANFGYPDAAVIFGAAIAILIQFIYFTTDTERLIQKQDVSVIRRMLWQMLHLPFHLAIIILGGCVSIVLKYMITSSYKSKIVDSNTRLAISISVFVILIILSLFVLLLNKETAYKTRIPLYGILGFRIFIAFAILSIGIFWTTVSAFDLLVSISLLSCGNLLFSIFAMQNVGELTLNDTACHIRWGDMPTISYEEELESLIPTNNNNKIENKQKRNVILLISDGFGPASETFARQYNQYIHKYSYDDILPLDTILVGSSRTQSSSSFITDSAAGATAFSCGLKSYNGAIAVDPNGKPCGTILESAKEHGFFTGLVATSRITHATPACFAAHVTSRDMENLIALHEIGNYSIGRHVDLMFGGGICHFQPNSNLQSCREDDVDVFSLAKEFGWNIGTNRNFFDSLTVKSKLPILNLFSQDHMAYNIDRNETLEPSLSQMASKALDILSNQNSGNGFFLMIEGSRIDMASHSNDPVAHVHDILEYQNTIDVVKRFVDKNPGTVLISVSDHETGGLSVGHQLGLVYPEYEWKPSVIELVKHSAEFMARAIINQKNSKVKHDFIIKTVLSKWMNITDFKEIDVEYLANSTSSVNIEYYLGHMVSDRAGVGWSSHGHSAVDVNLYSYGLNSNLLAGNHENTDIGAFISMFLSLDLGAITEKLTDTVVNPNATTVSKKAPSKARHYHKAIN